MPKSVSMDVRRASASLTSSQAFTSRCPLSISDTVCAAGKPTTLASSSCVKPRLFLITWIARPMECSGTKTSISLVILVKHNKNRQKIKIFLSQAKCRTDRPVTDRTYQMSDHLPMWVELKIDCGEFQTDHEVAKLIGAPPGYLGHRETRPVFGKPSS